MISCVCSLWPNDYSQPPDILLIPSFNRELPIVQCCWIVQKLASSWTMQQHFTQDSEYGEAIVLRSLPCSTDLYSYLYFCVFHMRVLVTGEKHVFYVWLAREGRGTGLGLVNSWLRGRYCRYCYLAVFDIIMGGELLNFLRIYSFILWKN